MERALTQSSLSVSLLPSMDYLWAGDDCSAGLQSGWLGSGKVLPLFLTRPRASKAIVHSLTAIPTLQHPPLPNVKIWFLFGQIVLLCLYFGKTICWELELEGVANERRSMLQVLAELGHHLWSSTAFSPQDLFATLKLNVMFLTACFEIFIALKNGQICMGLKKDKRSWLLKWLVSNQ